MLPLVTAVFVLMLTAPSTAQPLRIGSFGLGGPMLPVWVAQDKGLFAKHGLSTEVITFQGGSTTIQALLSGEVKISATSTDTGAGARARGAEIVGIAEWVNTFPYMFITAKEIDRPEKLKGKKVAISRFGGASHYAVRLVVSKMGLNPDKDIQLLQIGNEAVRMTALIQGVVDATVLAPPANLAARNLGFNVLTSLLQAGVKYSFDTVFVSRDFAGKNRETVIRFLRAFVSGIAYIKKNRAESVETLAKWLRITDRNALEETYSIFVEMFPQKPYGSEEGWRNLREVLTAADSRAKTLESREVFDYSYLREVDQSGFIDALYR